MLHLKDYYRLFEYIYCVYIITAFSAYIYKIQENTVVMK